MDVKEKGGGLVIDSVRRNSAAARVGIKAGDRLLAVAGAASRDSERPPAGPLPRAPRGQRAADDRPRAVRLRGQRTLRSHVSTSGVRWFVRGDVDGFFGLALDNLVQLLLIERLCRVVLGFPPELIYGRVLPGAAVSLVVGNLFYAWQAHRAGAAHRPQRRLRPALRHQHGVALRLRLPGHAAGQARRRGGRRGRPGTRRLAGGPRRMRSARASIELCGALVAERIRRATPRAALLSTLAGIALSFIALGFFYRTFARPARRLRDARGGAAHVLRPRPLPRRAARRPGGGALGTLLAWVIGIAPGARSAARRRAASSGARRSAISRRASAAGHLLAYALGDPADGSLQRSSARCRTSRARRPPATASPPLRRWPPTASARSPRRRSARAFPRRSTSAIPAGRRWAHAPAIRC